MEILLYCGCERYEVYLAAVRTTFPRFPGPFPCGRDRRSLIKFLSKFSETSGATSLVSFIDLKTEKARVPEVQER